MANSILYNVLSKLNDNDRKIAEAMLAKLNIFLNGDSELSAGRFEWKQDYETEGSLEKIKDRVYDLNDVLNSNLEYETYLIVLNQMKAICEGTDAEAEMQGVERSFLSYYGEVNNMSITEVKSSNCTDLHIVYAGNKNLLTWKDPNPVELNGVVIGKWTRTELWRVEGDAEPMMPNTGTNPVLLATTSSTDSLHPKDYFYTNVFEDNTIENGHEYTYKLFSFNEFDHSNNDSRNTFERSSSLSWPIIHKLSQDGVLSSYLSIGDIIIAEHEEFGDLRLRLVDYNGAEPVDPVANPHAAVFECVDFLSFKNTISFDLAYIEIVDPPYVVTPDTTFLSRKGILYKKRKQLCFSSCDARRFSACKHIF